MSPTIERDLRNTVIAGWYTRLSGNATPRRNHWQTRTNYFRAAEELLGTRPLAPLTWKSIVSAARPRGCRSTFYEVAGAHARHRMVDDLISDGRPDSVQLALRYVRTDPVEQLIDETKVWSYWPHRQRLLNHLLAAGGGTRAGAEQALVRTLLTWARQNEALAAATGHSPPACAVEDLTVLHQGRLAAMRAGARLSDVLRHAVTAAG
jgi:hypothetical protein